MKRTTECERVRLQMMAAFDGEIAGTADSHADTREHVAMCASCGRWLQQLESMSTRLEKAPYPGPPPDLWAAVEGRLSQAGAGQAATHRLWLVGALVVGWRALQLLVDLPLPAVHAVVPLAGALAALWMIARDPLAIETFAPELQKRGA